MANHEQGPGGNPERSADRYPDDLNAPVQRFFESATEALNAVDISRKAYEGLSPYVPVAERGIAGPIHLDNGGVRVDSIRFLGDTRDAQPVSGILNGTRINDAGLVRAVDHALGSQANYVEDMRAGGIFTEKLGADHILHRPHEKDGLIVHTVAPDRREWAIAVPDKRGQGGLVPLLGAVATLGENITALQQAAPRQEISAADKLIRAVEAIGRQSDGSVSREYRELQERIRDAVARGDRQYFAQALPEIAARMRAASPGGAMQTREAMTLTDLNGFVVFGKKRHGLFPSEQGSRILEMGVKAAALDRQDLRDVREGDAILRDLFGDHPDDPDTGGSAPTSPEPPRPTPPLPGQTVQQRDEQTPEREVRGAPENRSETPTREAGPEPEQRDSSQGANETSQDNARDKIVQDATQQARALAEPSSTRIAEVPVVEVTPARSDGQEPRVQQVAPVVLEAGGFITDEAVAAADEAAKAAQEAKDAAAAAKRKEQIEQAITPRSLVVDGDSKPPQTPEREIHDTLIGESKPAVRAPELGNATPAPERGFDPLGHMQNLLAQGQRDREATRGEIDSRRYEFTGPQTADERAREAAQDLRTHEAVAEAMRPQIAGAEAAQAHAQKLVQDRTKQLMREGLTHSQALDRAKTEAQNRVSQVVRNKGLEQDGRGIQRTRD